MKRRKKVVSNVSRLGDQRIGSESSWFEVVPGHPVCPGTRSLDPRSERATSERLTSDPGVLSPSSSSRIAFLYPATPLLPPPCRAVHTPLYTCALSAVASFK